MIKPFIRWCGGKTQILPQLLDLAPKKFDCYYEPFVGGGALYYALKPREAVLNDFNMRLVNAYQQITCNIEEVISCLQDFTCSKTCYYEQRIALNNENLNKLDAENAARFLFINKTCFNGLWRENAAGGFNVPYGGDRKTANHFDISNLRECSKLLNVNTNLSCLDFEDAVKTAKKDDFIYFDPPYIPVTATSFVDYKADGFVYVEQIRLRDLAKKLKDNGVHVMLSNSDTFLTRELYKEFELHEVKARRSINSDGNGRGKVGELIIR